jgi:hypothetical protein
MQVAAEDLLNAVLTARTEALRREKRVTLCVAQALSNKVSTALTQDLSDLPVQCDLTPSNVSNSSATWQQGWLMFETTTATAFWILLRYFCSNTKPLHNSHLCHGKWHSQSLHFIWCQWPQPDFEWWLSGGTLTFCEHLAQASPGWLLVINAVGHPRLEKTQVPQCL